MWKNVLSLFWKENHESLPLDEAYNLISECEEKLPKAQIEEEPEDFGTYEVCSKVGKVTKIEGETYWVDDLYEFTTEINDISVGTKISYQLIKSEGDIKVLDVHVIENDWDVIDTGIKSWHDRTLVCSVLKREGRILTLIPGDISINLNTVRSEFIPVSGDWVELEVKCENDENVVDLNGKIIEVDRLRPLRALVMKGQISKWHPEDDTGLMDKHIFFNRDSLLCGYLPIRGDKVVAEIIESNQGSCTWRALKIYPEHLHSKENKDTFFKDEDFSENDSVSITDDITLTFTKLGESKLFIMEIEPQEDLQLVCIEIAKLNGQIRLTESIDHVIIKAQRPLTLRLECKARSIGETRELVIFHFEQFRIRRWITILVVSEKPKNAKEYHRAPKYVVSRTKRETIRGQKISHSARFIPLQMPDYSVPERLLNLVTTYKENSNILKTELEKMKPCLVTTLSYMNFEDKFHTLLHLDEIHAVLEMQNYDQERACFIRSGEFLILEIENLAERRPSVIQGDRVYARSLQDTKSPDYEGIIHKITKNLAFIKFSPIFHDSYDGEDYSIYIVGARTTYRRKHFAVHLAIRNLGKEWLFPTRIVEKEPQLEFVFDNYVDCLDSSNELDALENKPSRNIIGKQRLLEKIQKFQEGPQEKIPILKLEWYNTSLNFFQKEAVRNSLLGVCRPLPYIVFGPPGTGKTVTIVETVLQILRLLPQSRILLSAPSNSAADLLALRLIDSGVLKPGDLMRLVAVTAVPGIPAKLAPYCATANVEREGTETTQPTVTPSGLVLGYTSGVLGRHRITVCTCSTAGVLYSMGFSKGHFSHIIVDEAGQTSEPSVLIPLAFLDLSSGQAILAGDPMQLGPTILSILAGSYGLDESFLERMISRFPYLRDPQGFPNTSGYDPRLITKLIYNYRSLPNLLKLPSVLFYNDDLRPTISEVGSKEAKILNQLEDMLPKNKDGSIASFVFHAVLGENHQTEESPSWFNPSEASQVFYYVNELYRLGLKASDIGIITPYKAQTRQLMELFKEAEFTFPKVGTVEEFQGQEFNVILLSTVRSNKKYLSLDVKYTMGFIASPRRLNVAITRAKALLIIVGNPDLLSTDRCWRSVINYCIDKGSFIGCSANGK